MSIYVDDHNWALAYFLSIVLSRKIPDNKALKEYKGALALKKILLSTLKKAL